MNTQFVFVALSVLVNVVLSALVWKRVRALEAKLACAATNAPVETDEDSEVSTSAESDQASRHFCQGNALTIENRHQEARLEYEAGLAIAQQESNLLLSAQILGNLGHSYLSTGEYARAVALLKCARALFLEIPECDEMLTWVASNLDFCEEHQRLAWFVEALASIDALTRRGLHDEAEEAIARAISRARKTLKAPAKGEHWAIGALLSRRAYSLMMNGF